MCIDILYMSVCQYQVQGINLHDMGGITVGILT